MPCPNCASERGCNCAVNELVPRTEKPEKPRCCPRCRHTQFLIEVPAVFHYDSAEEVVQSVLRSDPDTYRDMERFDSCTVVCDRCEWTGTVADLVEC